MERLSEKTDVQSKMPMPKIIALDLYKNDSTGTPSRIAGNSLIIKHFIY